MAANPKVVHNSIKSGKWVRSTCKMCLHSCTNLIHVTDDGVINKVEGDPTNPSNRGKLCPKGNSAIMRHYDPNRFKQPMKRTNPEKGPNIDPMWEPISWDEALDLVAEKIKDCLDDDPRRFVPSLEDFQKMNVWCWPLTFGNFNFFQSGGTMCGGAYHPVNGYIHSAFAAANDPKYCNFWLNNGTGDGFSSHLHAAAQSYWVANARARGMECVTVEPRLSISGAKSVQWIPIRPATDRQFAMSLCHVFVNEGWVDYKFLRRDTNAPYLVGEDGYFVRNADDKVLVWDTVAQAAKTWDDETIGKLALEGTFTVDGKPCSPAFQRFKDILDECSPEDMEKITTVPAQTVRELAKRFYDEAGIAEDRQIEIDGKTYPLRPAAYNYYRGAQGHKHGFQTNHAFKMVNFMLGNIDTPGGHMGVTLDDQWVDNNHCAMGENGMLHPTPHQLGPVPPFAYPPNTYHLMDYFPVGVHPPHLNMEVFLDPEKWGVEFTPDTMFVMHSNPIWAMQGPRNKWFEFMKSMKFIAVSDIIPTETTQWADVILPSHDVFETWNMTMIEPPHTEGMCMRQPAVDPMYDTKSEEEILYEITERLGLIDAYNEVQNFALNLVQKPELKLEPGIKYTDKEIARRKGLLWNDKDLDWYQEHGHSVTERRLDKWYRPWEGMRLHFYIEDMLKQRDDLHAKMVEADVPWRDEWFWGDYSPLPTAVLDPVHEEPPEFDLYGMFYKDIQLNFGESLSNPWIQDIVYRDPVHIAIMLNPRTAAAQGLEPLDVVKVESPYGLIYGRLGTSEGWHPDTLGVSNSLSRSGKLGGVKNAGGHFNDLLPYDIRNTDGVTGQPETVCKVKITKLDDWPQFLKEGGTVYELIDHIAEPGKGNLH
ncbi:MAG: molybdopterin-dependent oxidoreductase [Gammaproteobacteria bacterium]